MTVRKTLSPVYRFLWNKWWFDQLYGCTLCPARAVGLPRRSRASTGRGSTGLADRLATGVRRISTLDDWIDRIFVDGLVNLTARATYDLGTRLRSVETGRLRQYVMFVAVGTVALFVMVTFFWSYAFGARISHGILLPCYFSTPSFFCPRSGPW